MGKRKRKNNRNRTEAVAPGEVGEMLRQALRSILRDWKGLRAPLPVDEVGTPLAPGVIGFRVRGAETYEQLQERVIQFAGRVWQFKDGLIRWLQTQPLGIKDVDPTTGRTCDGTTAKYAQDVIEKSAERCLGLLLCADLYNSYKHYDSNCNRSGHKPFLSGVQLDARNAGCLSMNYDGARKEGVIMVANPSPVPICIELLSGNQHVTFGDAVVMIGKAFSYWVPLIRQMGLLSTDESVDRAILDDLAAMERDFDAPAVPRHASPGEESFGS